MKKLLILSVLLLCVVSVYAQYATVAVNPKMISTTIQPSGSCYDVCKRDCIASQRPADECAKVCEEKCRPAPQPVPQEDCQTTCKRLASQVSLTAKYAGFNFDVFLQCMRDRCKQDCESSCRMMYGNQMMDCVQKYCQPQETCEQGCDRKRDECLKTMVGINVESIRAACGRLHGECMQEQCGKPECPACPDCPLDCDDKCVDSYYNCAKMARTMTAQAGKPEDVQEEYMRRCRLGIAECLDLCAPELPPEYSCPERCRMVEKECLAAGVDSESCGMKVKDCVTQCYPQPMPPQNCEDRCVEMEKRCDELEPARRNTCLFDARICKVNCKPQPPEQPNCPILCERRHKECLDSNVDPAKCADDLKYCERLCGQNIPDVNVNGVSGRQMSPEELVGLNPQPEPPMPVGFWARMKSWFTG